MENKQSSKNSSTKISQPKFFRIIIIQPECTRLTIPVAFVRIHGKNLLNPVHLEVPDGKVWEVEVVHSRSQIWLTKGWQDFRDYYSVDCGHFLMFRYNGRSHFSVTIFDLWASEIEYPYNAAHVTPHEQERDQVESDDLHFLSDESSEGSKIVYDGNKRVTNKEESIAYQRAKAFKSDNPFITSFMQQSFVSKTFNLSVPFKFARKYFLKNRSDLVLRILGKGSWSVKCSFGKKKARLYSGWKAFVLDNKLKFGDACVFEVLEGTKLIDVTIFPASKEAEDDVSIDINIKSNEVDESQEDQTENEYDERTEIEETAESLGHCPVGQGKRIILEEEAEDDVSYDNHTKSIEVVDESQEDEASPSFTRKTRKGRESRRRHKQQSKAVFDWNKMTMEKESSIAYQRAKCFKSENPFIISFMQPSYLSTPYSLMVSRKFAQKYFLHKDSDYLVLRVPGRGSWPVKCSISSISTNTKIISGWKAFVLDNKLKIGDVCVLEVINVGKLIDVTIFPEAGSTSKHPIAGREVPGESCSENTVTAYEKAMAFTSKNPYFKCTMQPSYVSGRSLTIPWKTASKLFPDRHNNLVFRVQNKRSWPLKCSIGTNKKAYVMSGWKKFVLGNNIKVGDVCVFEQVNRSKLLFNVIIFPAAEEGV